MRKGVGGLVEKQVHYDRAHDGDFRSWLATQQEGGWRLVPNTGGSGTAHIFQRAWVGDEPNDLAD
jgi:hypothetical protein